MEYTSIVILIVLHSVVALYYTKDNIVHWVKDTFLGNDSDISAGSSNSRDLLQVIKENNKNYLVVYASQTGTAEDYAKRFAKDLTNKLNLNVLCIDVEDYDMNQLTELDRNIMLTIVISTYGEGDFPDGGFEWENDLKNLGNSDFEGIKFNIFGLGNSTYEFFNGAAKNAKKYMLNAGATIIGTFGEADDGKGTTDEDYLTWKDSNIDEISKLLNVAKTNSNNFRPSFKLTILNDINNNIALGEPTINLLPNKITSSTNTKHDINNPLIAQIVETNELFQNNTPDSNNTTINNRNCIHTEFDITGTNLNYQTGDHLAIWPSNANEKVDQFLQILHLNPDLIFNLTSDDKTLELPFPAPTTIGNAVRYYLEITGPISRDFFKSLIEFAPKDIKQYMINLSNDKVTFNEEIINKKLNLADILNNLTNGEPWKNVPWEFLLENLPKLLPRYYSISSSNKLDPNRIHVTSIVENSLNLNTGERVLGVTTNLLRNISMVKNNSNVKILPITYNLNGPRNLYQDFKLPIHVRHSNFKLPQNLSTPIIMIGPGTGIAPFRGFVRDRIATMNELTTNNSNQDIEMGKMLLFYGCRDENDFLYSDEWPQYSKTLDNKFQMHLAFSRVTDKKIYVQDKIRENQKNVFELIRQGAYIYICGDAAHMAHDVQIAIQEIISNEKQISMDDADEIIKMMKVNGTYLEDVW